MLTSEDIGAANLYLSWLSKNVMGHIFEVTYVRKIRHELNDLASTLAFAISRPFSVTCYASLHPALSIHLLISWSIGPSHFTFFMIFSCVLRDSTSYYVSPLVCLSVHPSICVSNFPFLAFMGLLVYKWCYCCYS